MVHHYYDHRTQQHRKQTLTQEEMIGHYISQVPEKHFKMVRYYGCLSNRKRGELLPKVYEALRMEARKKPEQPGFAALMKEFLPNVFCAATGCASSAQRPAGTPPNWWQKGCTASTGNDSFWRRLQDKCA